MPSWQSLSWLLLAPALSGATPSELEVLVDDAECTSHDDECALNALQRSSGRRLEATAGTCKEYGCVAYQKDHSCQCDDKCSDFGNCCADYRQTCASDGGSCHKYGCSAHNETQTCQCNNRCEEFGNCCSDYKAECGTPRGGSPGFSPTCSYYGCGGSFVKDQPCQCNDRCHEFSNCCPDYGQTCERNCKAYGCGKYDRTRQCQCNGECAHRGNCCSDYRDVCRRGPAPGHPIVEEQYPVRDGFTLTLVEEFNQPLDLDTDKVWTWSDGGLVEGDVRFVKEGIRFEEGKLKLIASDRTGSDIQSCSHAEVGYVARKKLTSGELRTRNNNFRYGYYEAKIKAPSVRPGDAHINGNFVAAFFLFRDGKFRHWREIDVEITGDSVDSLHTNMLSAEDEARWRLDMSDEETHNVRVDLRSDFHTYGIEWLPHRIRWFLDGKVIRVERGEKIPIPTMSAKIVLNLWIFSDLVQFGGKEIANNRYPMEVEVDWVRFYKWNDDDSYPCANLGTECLTEDDWYLSSNNPCDQIRQTGTAFGQKPCHAECGK